VSAADPFGFAAAIRVDHLTPAQAEQVVAIFEKKCAGCGATDQKLGGTDKCPDCVSVDTHNYRALHDGRMKLRSYR